MLYLYLHVHEIDLSRKENLDFRFKSSLCQDYYYFFYKKMPSKSSKVHSPLSIMQGLFETSEKVHILFPSVLFLPHK